MQNKRKSIRDIIVERKEKQKKANAVNFSSFLIDVKHNPMILIGLSGSALFTMLAGLFIGIAPERVDNNIILFGGATEPLPIIIGLFFATLYGVTFPLIGEWGMYYWHKKASLRDEGNKRQAVTAYAMLGLTVVFTAVTAIFASTILASLLSAFTLYTEIPANAQHWTITIIPVALIVHAVANIYYDHISLAAEERREMERELQSVEIESENRIRQARIAAKERAATAFADEYERVSETEAVQAGKNRANELWKNDKVELGAERDKGTNQPDGGSNNHPS